MNFKKIAVVLVVLMFSSALFLSAVPRQDQSEAKAPVQESNVTNARSAVHARLMEVGLSASDADSRLAKLSSADLLKLANNPAQVAMGGIEDKTLILIAVILIVPSLLILLLL